MTEFPLQLGELFGHWGSYVVYLIVGLGFGFSLESSGFGNSRILAAQFYFKNMTVLKVMFTGIIVAMALIFLSTALGLLDYNLIWVPPTYLWPGIVGGLIMGVGFIVGGFCPGTSLVAMATGKIDGMIFVAGVLFGIFMFGETISSYDVFFESSYMGRFTLPELFNASYGIVVLCIVIGALFLFMGVEKLEAALNNESKRKAPKWALPSAVALAGIAFIGMLIGQPANQDRWALIETEAQAQLDKREVQINPAELIKYIHDPKIKTVVLDVRDESSFNQFHIQNAQRLPMDKVQAAAKELQFEKANTVLVLTSNDETLATQAWKILKAESIQNLYILEGGVNNWLNTYAADSFKQTNFIPEHSDDTLSYQFNAATGSRHPAAEPNPHEFHVEFEPKVILKLKRAPASGGCG